jgi:hypothetical protein
VWDNQLMFMVSDRTDPGNNNPVCMMVCKPEIQEHHWSQPPMWGFTPDGDPIYHEGLLKVGVTPETVAREQFADVFGEWQARGCRVFCKAEFLEKYLPFIPGALATVLASDRDWPQEINWHQQMYIKYHRGK